MQPQYQPAGRAMTLLDMRRYDVLQQCNNHGRIAKHFHPGIISTMEEQGLLTPLGTGKWDKTISLYGLTTEGLAAYARMQTTPTAKKNDHIDPD
jgi:hypothetical protein